MDVERNVARHINHRVFRGDILVHDTHWHRPVRAQLVDVGRD
jgi:hypothetical protein